MYVVFTAKTREKLIASTTGINGMSNNGFQTEQVKNPTNNNDCSSSISHNETIPSLKNGQLRWFGSSSEGLPSFMYWVSKSPLMVFHHLFIGWYGLLVITYLRGALGDCVLSFFYIMELSTPFVSLRSILATINLKESRLYIVNGLTMVAFFFVFRICIVPYAFYWYMSFANINILEVSFCLSFPKRDFWYFFFSLQAFNRLPTHCKVSIVLITLPQFYWFKLMVNGAIKVMYSNKTL